MVNIEMGSNCNSESKDCITTYTGIHMNPLDPRPEDFRIEDIAHALPLICRGNGHVKTFFSVGQHCINCAREAEALKLPDRMVLACLLHDASECYLSDVPRPFKRNLPFYREAEDRLLSVVFTHFLGSDLIVEEYKQMKQIDIAMLWYDMHELLDEDIGPKPEVHIEISYEWRPFAEVEKEYLALYREHAAGLSTGEASA